MPDIIPKERSAFNSNKHCWKWLQMKSTRKLFKLESNPSFQSHGNHPPTSEPSSSSTMTPPSHKNSVLAELALASRSKMPEAYDPLTHHITSTSIASKKVVPCNSQDPRKSCPLVECSGRAISSPQSRAQVHKQGAKIAEKPI